MTALVLNTRRGPLADPAVRRAMIELFDFEWITQSLYHGRYARTDSYFARSDLASTGSSSGEGLVLWGGAQGAVQVLARLAPPPA